jgi:hypothetical protein
MVQRIAAMQDYERTAIRLGGLVRVPRRHSRAATDANTPARLRHGHLYGTEEYIDNKKKLVRYSFPRRSTKAKTPSSGSTSLSCA